MISEVPNSMSNWAFQPILHERFNVLKARSFNLIDSIMDSENDNRAKAVKGLMRDFLNQAYYDSLRAMEDFLREKKLISENEGQSGGYVALEARSLEDVHVKEVR